MDTEEPREIFDKELLEIVKQFCLMDDDFMSVVLEHNPKAVELILNIILDRDDLHVNPEDIHVQQVIPNSPHRSVRLDVLATDSTGKVYNIEIQRDDRGAGIRRARYNSALIDSTMLNEGDKTSELNDSFVIFITERDVLGRNQPIYHIDRVIRETGEVFQDGSHILYVNGSNRDDTPLGQLMQDFHCKKSADMNYKDLAESVKYYKEDDGGYNMCKLIEDYMEKRSRIAEQKGEQRGEEKGENAKAKETARKMIAKGMDYAEIAELVGLSLAQVEKLAEESK
jgi:predicted transposase/invertase (TIGR01784 family)